MATTEKIEFSVDSTPDFSRFEKVLRRTGTPDRVPFYELFSNIEGRALEAVGAAPELDDAMDDWEKGARTHFAHQAAMGYDHVIIGGAWPGFPLNPRPVGSDPSGDRAYVQAGNSTIPDREHFEQYPWPDISKVDYAALDRALPLLPGGAKGIVSTSGVLENAMWLMGYEQISYALFEDEPLVADVFEAVATRIIEYLSTAAAYDAVGAICLGDDLGFKTQTLLSPQAYRDHVFPWHKKLVEAAHAAGKPALLHACGFADEIMDDIIACGWDAKHSFEDVIEPVWEQKPRYGGRITLLGGFDVDKLTRMTPEQVRAHTRMMIDKCAPGGGWALGSGNSVANYIPVENYLAMIDEGFRYGRY